MSVSPPVTTRDGDTIMGIQSPDAGQLHPSIQPWK